MDMAEKEHLRMLQKPGKRQRRVRPTPYIEEQRRSVGRPRKMTEQEYYEHEGSIIPALTITSVTEDIRKLSENIDINALKEKADKIEKSTKESKGNTGDVARYLATVKQQGIRQSKRQIDEVLGAIWAVLLENGALTLRDFGRLDLALRGARSGHSPQTGEPIDINETIVAKFKLSKNLLRYLETEYILPNPTAKEHRALVDYAHKRETSTVAKGKTVKK